MSVVDNLYTVIDNGRKGLNKGLSTGLAKLDKIRPKNEWLHINKTT